MTRGGPLQFDHLEVTLGRRLSQHALNMRVTHNATVRDDRKAFRQDVLAAFLAGLPVESGFPECARDWLNWLEGASKEEASRFVPRSPSRGKSKHSGLFTAFSQLV